MVIDREKVDYFNEYIARPEFVQDVAFASARFRYDISTQDWDRVNNYDDPNVMWDIWKNLFFLCVDKHAPLRTKRIPTSKSPWITPQLKKRMHYKDVLKVKAIRSGNACDWLIFKKMSQRCKQ